MKHLIIGFVLGVIVSNWMPPVVVWLYKSYTAWRRKHKQAAYERDQRRKGMALRRHWWT